MEVEQSLSQRQGFSSEQFKIEIQNLPKFFGIGQMKKLLVKRLKVKPHKIKPCGPKATYMFMNFANEEDREDAITKLDGYEIKGKKLKAFKIRAAKDPMIKAKEKLEAENGKVVEMDIRPVRERILSVVCPLADKNYQQQLEIKKTAIEDILRQFREKFMRTNRFFKNHNIGKFFLK